MQRRCPGALACGVLLEDAGRDLGAAKLGVYAPVAAVEDVAAAAAGLAVEVAVVLEAVAVDSQILGAIRVRRRFGRGLLRRR